MPWICEEAIHRTCIFVSGGDKRYKRQGIVCGIWLRKARIEMFSQSAEQGAEGGLTQCTRTNDSACLSGVPDVPWCHTKLACYLSIFHYSTCHMNIYGNHAKFKD